MTVELQNLLQRSGRKVRNMVRMRMGNSSRSLTRSSRSDSGGGVESDRSSPVVAKGEKKWAREGKEGKEGKEEKEGRGGVRMPGGKDEEGSLGSSLGRSAEGSVKGALDGKHRRIPSEKSVSFGEHGGAVA
jgi:hypothetical protein